MWREHCAREARPLLLRPTIMMPMCHILITGTRGYIGSRLVERALSRGWWVTTLGRGAPVGFSTSARLRHFDWRYGVPPSAAALTAGGSVPPVDVIVHAAHQWSSDGDDPNKPGTDALLAAARAQGAVRFIFLSSLSAREDALNRYGRVKWQIESALAGPQEIAARIGLVYGGPRRGQWGTLCSLVATLPVLPMVASDTPVQPIHLEDLCEGLLRLAERPNLGRRIYGLAGEALPFQAFLRELAQGCLGRRLKIVHVPAAPVLWLIDRINSLGIVRVDRERVLGLVGLRTMETQSSLEEIGLRLRPLGDGLAAESDPRRALLVEGRALLRYVGGCGPNSFALRTYVRGVERQQRTQALKLPIWAAIHPALLALCEPLRKQGLPAERLYLATLVADALGDRSAAVYPYVGDGLARAAGSLVLVALRELALMPLRAVLGTRWR